MLDYGGLECPELLVCALDLVISHHQRYLEAKQFSPLESENKINVKSHASPNCSRLSETSPEILTKESKTKRDPEFGDSRTAEETDNAQKGSECEDKTFILNEFIEGRKDEAKRSNDGEIDKLTSTQTTSSKNNHSLEEDLNVKDLSEIGGATAPMKEKEPKCFASASNIKKKKSRRKRARRKAQNEPFVNEDEPTFKSIFNSVEELAPKAKPMEASENVLVFKASPFAKSDEEEASFPTFEEKDSVREPLENEKTIQTDRLTSENLQSHEDVASGSSSTKKSSQSNLAMNESSSLSITFKTNSSSSSSFLKPPLCTSVEEGHISVLSQTLHDILIICKGSESVCLQLQHLHFLQKLIDGFSKLIKTNDSSYEGKKNCNF